MLKKRIISLLIILLLAGCAPQADLPAPVEKEEILTESASPLPPPTAETQKVIRYAILVPTTEVNIWSLFDEEGASYENYAVQGSYYPRLYHLVPPDNELSPLLADGFPSAFVQEGDFFTSQVSLLPNLTWDDGSPLTAEDVAFTINTALAFELGLNWADFYDKEELDHVEALDATTLKYYFSSPPNAGDWQHGALIGVFASKSYWQPKIANAKSLLPTGEDIPLIAEYQANLATLLAEEQSILKTMKGIERESTSTAYREQELLLNANLAEQDFYTKSIETLKREKRASFSAARARLYALDNAREPHAGLWQFSSQEKNFIENTALAASHFQTARYTIYEADAAHQALLDDEIDFILSPHSLNAAEIEQLSADSDIHFFENRRNDIRFLAFNHQRTPLDDIALRRALSCLIDPNFLATDRLEGRVAPALGWIHPENIGWHSGIIEPPCTGLDADARLAAGMRILQKAGYVWEQEPSPNHAGSGLKLPSGEDFPPLSLLAPREDSSRADAASYIAEIAHQLGIPLRAEIIPADDLFFKVYGINDYDLAIVGWSLSLYPDYLCNFFAEENPYSYSNARVKEKCVEFSITNDIEQAREQLFEIEVLLWDDLPAVPLFSSKITEAYRNISFPFDHILGGIAPTLYGAPTLAE